MHRHLGAGETTVLSNHKTYTMREQRLSITDSNLERRVPDPKRTATKNFQALNYQVIAAGDSYNDTTMLLAADAGYLFHSPPNVQTEFPQLPALAEFDELLTAITGHLARE